MARRELNGPPSIRAIIDAYNERFTDASAAEHQSLLDSALAGENLVFGDRPLTRVLRPQLLSAGDYRAVADTCRVLLGAIARIYSASCDDTAIRERLMLEPLEEEAAAIDPGYRTPAPLARLDGFRGADGVLRFVEYNAETPAGVGYMDMLVRVFREFPAVQELGRRYRVRAVRGRSVLLEALLAIGREAGIGGAPAVGILDWRGVPTSPEFEILARYFTDHGVPTVVGAPDELRLQAGRLYLRDLPVTIVYKRVLCAEFLAREGLDHPLVEAIRTGAAVMANPFRCMVLHKKALFALLTDPSLSYLLTAEEQAVVAAHVPWTRVVADGPTTYEGVRVDLLEWVTENRTRLVLKPNDDYGGRGVTLGWEVDEAGFAAALQAALSRPSVVQERVDAEPEPFPLWDGQRLQVEDRLVDLDPYCYHGTHMHGTLSRLSSGGLLNVTAGGGSVVPSFVVSLPEANTASSSLGAAQVDVAAARGPQ